MTASCSRDMKKQKKTVVVEHRYIGAAEFIDRGWYRWHAYRDLETAESVVEQLSRKFKSFEFRVKKEKIGQT